MKRINFFLFTLLLLNYAHSELKEAESNGLKCGEKTFTNDDVSSIRRKISGVLALEALLNPNTTTKLSTQQLDEHYDPKTNEKYVPPYIKIFSLYNDWTEIAVSNRGLILKTELLCQLLTKKRVSIDTLKEFGIEEIIIDVSIIDNKAQIAIKTNGKRHDYKYLPPIDYEIMPKKYKIIEVRFVKNLNKNSKYYSKYKEYIGSSIEIETRRVSNEITYSWWHRKSNDYYRSLGSGAYYSGYLMFRYGTYNWPYPVAGLGAIYRDIDGKYYYVFYYGIELELEPIVDKDNAAGEKHSPSTPTE